MIIMKPSNGAGKRAGEKRRIAMFHALIIATNRRFEWSAKKDRDDWIAKRPDERRLLIGSELDKLTRERKGKK